MPITKEQKAMQNRRAYLKRKARELGVEPESLEDDNIAPVQSRPESKAVSPKVEPEEFEIDYAEYKRFKEWQKLNEDIKKKGSDPSYIFPILKSLGVALVPALIGAVQRAAIKTVEQSQHPEQTKSPHSTDPSNVTGSGQWDPLSQPKLSTQ